jgi:hypothetical protein
MRYVYMMCGASRDDGDNCAVVPFGRQDCRWYRRQPVLGARRHEVRTLVLVAVLMATAVSTISAMRLNPLAVSTIVDDRRPFRHAVWDIDEQRYVEWDPAPVQKPAGCLTCARPPSWSAMRWPG